MACNTRNGKTYFNSLTPFPGGTAAATSYLLDATHFTCGNKKMCINSAEGFPLVNAFEVQVLGQPRSLGGDTYCCDIRCICDLTYQQVYGCCGGCQNTCLQTEKIVVTQCVPCPSAEVPTVTANGVVCSPVEVQCGCSSTNQVHVEFSFEVAEQAAP